MPTSSASTARAARAASASCCSRTTAITRRPTCGSSWATGSRRSATTTTGNSPSRRCWRCLRQLPQQRRPAEHCRAHFTQNQDGSITANLTLRNGNRRSSAAPPETAAWTRWPLPSSSSRHGLHPDPLQRARAGPRHRLPGLLLRGAEMGRWQRDLGLRHPHGHHRGRRPGAGECDQ